MGYSKLNNITIKIIRTSMDAFIYSKIINIEHQ